MLCYNLFSACHDEPKPIEATVALRGRPLCDLASRRTVTSCQRAFVVLGSAHIEIRYFFVNHPKMRVMVQEKKSRTMMTRKKMEREMAMMLEATGRARMLAATGKANTLEATRRTRVDTATVCLSGLLCHGFCFLITKHPANSRQHHNDPLVMTKACVASLFCRLPTKVS